MDNTTERPKVFAKLVDELWGFSTEFSLDKYAINGSDVYLVVATSTYPNKHGYTRGNTITDYGWGLKRNLHSIDYAVAAKSAIDTVQHDIDSGMYSTTTKFDIIDPELRAN